MGYIKFLIFLLVLAAGYKWWHKHPTAFSDVAVASVAGQTGFEPMSQRWGRTSARC